MHAAGGPDAFLDDHAVIVVSDHSQAPVEERIRLDEALLDFDVATRSAARSSGAEIALSPAQRSAMIYALDEDRRAELVQSSVDAVCDIDGVDIVAWCARGEEPEAALRTPRGELRFAPGGDLEDARGRRWNIDGEPAAVRASIAEGLISTPEYPDALGRLWEALHCANAGDVLMSAAPGYEFVDWGGADHVGGGSHGSLHASDSLGALVWCGTGPETSQPRRQWSLQDVTPMIAAHFGVGSGAWDESGGQLAGR
jgi:hypothetical protein